MKGTPTTLFFLLSFLLLVCNHGREVSAYNPVQNTTSFISESQKTKSSNGNDWTKVNNGPFSAREGLMAVSTGNFLFLSGGRDGYGLKFSSEIWRSEDGGEHWVKAAEGFFPGRAYHAHVIVENCMYIMGGQDLKTFYNDIWKSCDGLGEDWSLVTDAAPWPKRAGIAFTTRKINQNQINLTH